MTARELRTALRRLGLSQVRAARALGVSQPAVSRWCTGVERVPGPVAAALRAWLTYGLPSEPARDAAGH